MKDTESRQEDEISSPIAGPAEASLFSVTGSAVLLDDGGQPNAIIGCA